MHKTITWRKRNNKEATKIKINLRVLGKNKPKLAMVLPEDQYITKDTEKWDSYIVEDEKEIETMSAILSTSKKDSKYPSTNKTQQQDKGKN